MAAQPSLCNICEGSTARYSILVERHATTACCSVRLCDIGSYSDCSVLPIHQRGGRKGQSKEPKVLHSIRLYALALERPHLARLPNDTLAFL
jgi:hypothetical protein